MAFECEKGAYVFLIVYSSALTAILLILLLLYSCKSRLKPAKAVKVEASGSEKGAQH